MSGEREMDELLKQCRDALIEAKYFFDDDFPDGSDGPCAVTGRYRAAFKSIEALLPKLDAALAQPQHRDAPEGMVEVAARAMSFHLTVSEEAWAEYVDDVKPILAAIQPMLRDAPEGWKTIESAPEGGIPFDVWATAGPGDNGFRVANCWANDDGVSVPAGTMLSPFCEITHWRPIPPSPSEPKEDKP